MKVAIKPFDAAWFYIERPEAPVHFAPLLILSPPADAPTTFIRDFVEQWRQCKACAPPFNYRLRRGRLPAWDVLDDDEIDLDYHFRHSALPAPGGERELGNFVSRLHTHRLDRRRPLWECHVIEGLENGRFAIYLKLHHGQLDGIGASRLMTRMCSTDPNVRGLLPPWSVGMQTRKTPRRPGLGGKSQRQETPSAARQLAALPQTLRALSHLAREAFVEEKSEVAAPFRAPNTILNGRIGGSRRFATQHYPLERFRHIAKAADVTINDVFLSISGAALRRYLLELDALPKRTLIGQVPVNVRPAGDSSVGNKLAFMYAHLHTDIADPIERLHAVHASVSSGKSRHESLPPAGIDSFTMMMLAPYITSMMLDLGGRIPPAANLVISNVPGPRERLYFNGARVDQIYGPSVLFHGQALNITMSSYVDEINIGYTGCRESLPSMQKLAVYTGDALLELEQLLGLA